MADDELAVAKRLDRELNELLQELRVVQGGILILVGFLLVVAFSPRFENITEFQEWTYFVTLMVTGTAALTIIAPVAHHRLAFRRHDKESVIVRGNVFVLVSLGLVAISILGIAVLVTDLIFGATLTALVAISYCATVLALWIVLPLSSLRQPGHERADPAPSTSSE